jgi:hypothetical protein
MVIILTIILIINREVIMPNINGISMAREYLSPLKIQSESPRLKLTENVLNTEEKKTGKLDGLIIVAYSQTLCDSHH